MKMSIFKKEENSLVTIKEKYNLVQNINVADVKQYLRDEYARAYERENIITTLENKILQLEKKEMEYNALLVISDENRTRLLSSEDKIRELKDIIENQKLDNKTLKNNNNNIELNYNKILSQKDKEIKDYIKQIKKIEKSKK